MTAPNSAAPPIPVKASGSHFYKYSAFIGERRGWLKEIIVEHRLYVPKLTQLDDPPDGRPKLARKSEDELYSFLYKGPFGVLSRYPHMTVEEQVKHGAILDLSIKRHGAEGLMRAMAETLYTKMDDWRIYSLSKRSDSPSLWAQYGDEHRGYCLEFANEGAFFGSAMEVIYGDSVEFDIDKPEHRNGYWFFCKKRDWSYQEEVRVLVPRLSDGRIQIDPRWLTRIILGWKMPEVDRARIREWGKQRSPGLKVVSTKYDVLDQVIRVED